MASIAVSVIDANNISLVLTARPPVSVTLDRGVAGIGIASISGTTISGSYYLVVTYTNGATQNVGPFALTGTVAAGSTTQIQYNSGGALAGSANLTWNGSALGVGGAVNATGGVTDTQSANTARMVAGAAGVYFGSTTNTPVVVQVNSSAISTFSSTGLAVTGALSATGNVSTSGSLSASGAATANAANLGFSGTQDIFTVAGQAATIGPLVTSQSYNGTAYAPLTITGLTFTWKYAGGTSVLAASSTGLAITGTLSSTGNMLCSTGTDGAKIAMGFNGGTYSAIGGTLTNGGGTTAGTLEFYTANLAGLVKQMTLDQSGIFLIGTTTATGTNKFQLSTDARINGITVGKGNNSGSNNTAFGVNALNAATASGVDGVLNTAVGFNSLQSTTTGSSNTAIGYRSLYLNTSGMLNTAIGYQSLYANTSGGNNTSIGYFALGANSTGTANTAIGNLALRNNTTASNNVAIGYYSLFANLTGTNNLALGATSLPSNTTGSNNVALGANTLFYNVSGSGNTAIGQSSLYYNTSNYNTVMGFNAMYGTTSGSSNTSVGVNSLFANTTGNYNVGFGYQALFNSVSGSANTAISPLTDTGSYSPVFDPTTQSNRFCMGSTAVTNAYIQVAWTVVSDARDKTNFAAIPHGLDFVNQLKPTAFQFKVSREDETPTGPVRYGFKAQDVLELEGNNPVVVDAEDSEKLRFNESSLIPILVKAIQELTARLAILESK